MIQGNSHNEKSLISCRCSQFLDFSRYDLKLHNMIGPGIENDACRRFSIISAYRRRICFFAHLPIHPFTYSPIHLLDACHCFSGSVSLVGEFVKFAPPRAGFYYGIRGLADRIDLSPAVGSSGNHSAAISLRVAPFCTVIVNASEGLSDFPPLWRFCVSALGISPFAKIFASTFSLSACVASPFAPGI